MEGMVAFVGAFLYIGVGVCVCLHVLRDVGWKLGMGIYGMVYRTEFPLSR